MAEDRQQRRLATILAADVFGYSRLTAENEEDALRTLKAHRGVIDRLISRHEGRIFNTAGDSVLAEFGSAVEAVRCAITIQEELRVRNAQIDENRRMEFRIGINVGDVLVDGDNLYGDGVNIAARLESIATPGGICISGSVFALVKNKLSYSFEDIGLQTVKNIPEPVSTFRLTSGPSAGQAPTAARSARSWTLPIAAVVAAVVIAGAGIFYWAERGRERIARPINAPPTVSAPLASVPPAPVPLASRRSRPRPPCPSPSPRPRVRDAPTRRRRTRAYAPICWHDRAWHFDRHRQAVRDDARRGRHRRGQDRARQRWPIYRGYRPMVDRAQRTFLHPLHALCRRQPRLPRAGGRGRRHQGLHLGSPAKSLGVQEIKARSFLAFAAAALNGRFWGIADVGGFWSAMVRSRMTQSGNMLCERFHVSRRVMLANNRYVPPRLIAKCRVIMLK